MQKLYQHQIRPKRHSLRELVQIASRFGEGVYAFATVMLTQVVSQDLKNRRMGQTIAICPLVCWVDIHAIVYEQLSPT